MKFTRIQQVWRIEKLPPGSSFWAPVMGHLIAHGADHHRTIMDHWIPHAVVGGQGVVRNEYGVFRVQAGDLFCFWPGVVYELDGCRDAPWELCWFHLEGDGARDYVEALGFRRQCTLRRPPTPGPVVEVVHRCKRLFEERDRETPTRMMRELLSLVDHCGGDARDGNAVVDPLADALVLMRSSLHTGLNINDICAAVGVHRVTLARQFRERFGCSPLAWLTRMRLERAQELLRTTEMSLDDIADAVGFGDGKYLIRWFRSQCGVAPGAWRNANRVLSD